MISNLQIWKVMRKLFYKSKTHKIMFYSYSISETNKNSYSSLSNRYICY